MCCDAPFKLWAEHLFSETICAKLEYNNYQYPNFALQTEHDTEQTHGQIHRLYLFSMWARVCAQ